MSIITNLLNIAQTQGIFEFYLPFLLTFAIFYALLVKTKIFTDSGGKQQKGVIVIVALVAALYVVHYTTIGTSIGTLFTTLFGKTSVLLVVVIVIVVVLGVLSIPMILGEEGVKTGFLTGSWQKLIVVILAILIILSFLNGSGINIPGLPNIGISLGKLGISQDVIGLILFVIVTVIIIMLVSREEK